MSLFDWFTVTTRCAGCGEMQATRSMFGRIRCPNRTCEYFDVELMNRLSSEGTFRPSAAPLRSPESAPPQRQRRTRGDFVPREPIEVRYRNFRGEFCSFVGDATTLHRRNQHYSLCVVPTGRRIALAADRIENRNEVERRAVEVPTPREAHVMRYHAKRGTTSELNERLRAKYPRWQVD